jgi:hypothetical protein
MIENGYHVWIDQHLIPQFFRITKQVANKMFVYNFPLASAAKLHAEAMKREGRIYHTPAHMMVGSAENVSMLEVRTGNFDEALWKIAQAFRDDYVHGHNLLRHRDIGIGLAINWNNRRAPELYVVQRFAN